MLANELISYDRPLSQFGSVTLDEIASVKLMNRVDAKYVTTERVLLDILRDAVVAGYRVLEIDGVRLNRYDSLYYDTSAFSMFMAHRNRKLVRQKIRTRLYITTGVSFFEIKRKNNKGRTKKKRVEIPTSCFGDFRDDSNATEFLSLHSAYSKDVVAPAVETLFDRITLVNPDLTERLTIDTSLKFVNKRSGKSASLYDAVIIELKQDGRRESQMKKIFLSHRVKPMRVSKYCMAITLTEPSVRPGRFNVKVRKIEKIINKKITVL